MTGSRVEVPMTRALFQTVAICGTALIAGVLPGYLISPRLRANPLSLVPERASAGRTEVNVPEPAERLALCQEIALLEKARNREAARLAADADRLKGLLSRIPELNPISGASLPNGTPNSTPLSAVTRRTAISSPALSPRSCPTNTPASMRFSRTSSPRSATTKSLSSPSPLEWATAPRRRRSTYLPHSPLPPGRNRDEGHGSPRQ